MQIYVKLVFPEKLDFINATVNPVGKGSSEFCIKFVVDQMISSLKNSWYFFDLRKARF
jgi:hypothetical protein